MMLVNFALKIVGTKITSDKVSTDGFECSNLISESWHLRRKGFLTEHFIKPPVNITLEFPCNIYIHSVYLTPCVGQQQSSQIELYSASKPIPRTTRSHNSKCLNSSTVLSVNSSKFTAGYSTEATVSSLPAFHQIARSSVSDSNCVCFYNPDFNSHFGQGLAYEDINSDKKLVINSFRKEVTAASSHLMIRVVRTHNASTAALSNIDIWGLPALSVPSVIKDEILNKYRNFIKPLSLDHGSALPQKSSVEEKLVSLSPSGTSLKQENLSIPEEFIDPLTCEIMAIPMLLPCGNNVDMSTLDRYFNVEASFCRQPRDPFTGVEFSNTTRPIPNGALKARIDQFLMKHAQNSVLATVARTATPAILGKRKASETTEGVSSLVIQTCGSEALSESKKLRQNKCSGSPCENIAQTKTVESIDLPKLDETFKINEMKNVNESRQKLIGEFEGECSTGNIRSSVLTSHESLLTSSLNEALSSLLSGLPSFTAAITHKDNAVNSEICSVCKEMLTADLASYSLPCHHWMCRKCLTSELSGSGRNCCGTCSEIFDKTNVVRRHLKTKW